MNPLLLGGWRDVVDDLRRLAGTLARVPATCSCGDGSVRLAGTGACCRGREHVNDGCTDCEGLLGVIREEMADLVDRTLRFLPALEHEPVPDAQSDQPRLVAHLRRQILKAAETFQQIETAGSEYRLGCSTAQLDTMRTLASQLLVEADQVEQTLRGIVVARRSGNATDGEWSALTTSKVGEQGRVKGRGSYGS